MQDNLIHEQRYKNSKLITSKLNPTIYKMNKTMINFISEQDRLNNVNSMTACKIGTEKERG